MAHIIGTSGAWKAVCKEINRVRLHPKNISEIPTLFKVAKEEYELKLDKSMQDIDNQIAFLKTELVMRETNFSEDVRKNQDRISADIELAQTALRPLVENVGFIERLMNYFQIRTIKEKIRLLQKQFGNCPKQFQEKIELARNDFEKTQKNRDALVAKKCNIEKQKMDLLECIGSSPDLAGATAELELIDSLKTLPDNYYIISDVRLRLRKPIHFDNEWLASAQIDHIVVCPVGIFVIEVKNWSKTFSEQGDYFNPYQQVKRASYLCYKLVGKKYNLKTRSIIAHKGAIPQKPNDSYAKVLPIHEVRNYILQFKEISATNQMIQLAASQLSRF